jgi:peptidoglycan/xylan/chitin deacetylase (PgdA/CDA1 family)
MKTATPPRHWTVRQRLPTGLRRVARGTADLLIAPVAGSVAGSRGSLRAVAITFDDGPDPQVTPALLDMLAQRASRATFFLLVPAAEAHPALVRRVAAEGHEVALHGDRHHRLTGLRALEVRNRLRTSRRRLEAVVGQPVRLFRPPFGAQSLASYAGARWAGLRVVVWSADASDWVDGTAEEVSRRALAHVRPGGILLFHETLVADEHGRGAATSFDRVEAARLIIDGLADRSLRRPTVSELIAGGAHRTAWFRP